MATGGGGGGSAGIGSGASAGTGSASGLASALGISDDQLAQLQRALQAAGSSFAGATGTGSQAGFMRAGPSPYMTQGQPNNLLTAILQMRANQAAAMGQPYQAGLAAPATSLLR